MTHGISGGPINQFREGWAIIPFIHKPHYWRRIQMQRRFRSLCGIDHDTSGFLNDGRGFNPLAPGVFMVDRCKNCSRKHSRS
jgi:hypothetical protein